MDNQKEHKHEGGSRLEKKPKKSRLTRQQKILLAVVVILAIALAVVLTVITTGCCHIILRWMKTPENILAESYAYFWVICLGIPFTFLYNTVSGIIRALGDSRTPFYFLVISTILNIILDLVFIITLHWGVAGAAWATIIAQALSGVMCLIYMMSSTHCRRR